MMDSIPQINIGDRSTCIISSLAKYGEKKAYLEYNSKYTYNEALILIPEYCVCLCKTLLVVVHTPSNRIIRLYQVRKGVITGEIDLSGLLSDCILDLTFSGERWEGDVFNCTPCGWGCYYDDRGELLYHGLMIGDKKMYYGTEYYSKYDMMIKYQGNWINNKYFGVGISYDLNGDVDCMGEWINNHCITVFKLKVSNSDIHHCPHSLLTELTIANHTSLHRACQELNLSSLVSLRKLSIGDHCFGSLLSFTIASLRNLVSITVGKSSFAKSRAFSNESISSSASAFTVSACLSLKTIVIKEGAFRYYSTFTIQSLPKLKTLSIGGTARQPCFDRCHQFAVDSFPQLRSVQIGTQCFRLARNVLFKGKMILAMGYY